MMVTSGFVMLLNTLYLPLRISPCILASSTDSCPVTTRGKKMPRILAKTGYYPPIQESICISGCNSLQKVWRNPTLRRLPEHLNAISIRDSFPLPRIEEALQAVQAAVWFTSFDLAQGYLQMAMEEADIPKTAFRAGSSGLFEFTRMPFGLTNAGASFCRLMEMVIGDQQFVTSVVLFV